jgi:hypothetical protein
MGVMKSKDPDKFEIRFDDTAPEPIDPEDMQEHRLDRLRLRITLVAILIPCLLGLLLLAGYFDLKRRMTAVDTTGSTEVKKVSKTLESSFSSVSVQVAKLEENVNKRLDAMQKSLGTQAQRLEKLEKELGRLDRAKADDKALSSAVEKEKTARSAADDKIASTIAELAATRKEQDLKIAAASADLVKTATRIDSMQTELRALEAEVETLAELRTDLKVLDLARKEDRDSLEKKLSSLAGDLRQRIEELSRKLSELSRKPAAQSGEPAAKPAPSAAKPTAQPPQPPAPTDSGSILEQDLK